MTKKEALQILAILKAAYPHSYNGMSEKEAIGTVTVWSTQFSDVSASIVMMAVNKLISTSKFPPSIAEVKAKIGKIHWEAYDVLYRNEFGEDAIPEERLKLYERIYQETKKYKHSKIAEPSIAQMIESSGLEMKMLE